MIGAFEMKTRRRAQTPPEEIANSLCHGLGFVAVLAAYPTLLATARRHGLPHAIAGVSLYALTTAMLFLFSSVYHALPRNEMKRLFQRLDQSAIFLCIAGSYTPFAIGSLRTDWDWAGFWTIWGLSLFAIGFRAYQGFRGTHFTTFLYVVISGLALIALRPAFRDLPRHGLWWVVAGMSLYAVGILFFLAHQLRFAHLAWHTCAVAGSVCQFLAVFWYAC